MKKDRRIFLPGLVMTLTVLMGCDSPGQNPEEPACACLADRSAAITDTLGGLVNDVIHGGMLNGFPGPFQRSCDSINYTFTAWIDIGPRIGPDSQSALNQLPMQVKLKRQGNLLYYSVDFNDEPFAVDSIPEWWVALGTGDSSTCLPNVENIIVDSIDARILKQLDSSMGTLVATKSVISASCDTLLSRVVFSDASPFQILDFTLTTIGLDSQITSTAKLNAQTFPLFQSDRECRELGE